MAKSTQRVKVLRTVFQLLASRDGRLSMHTRSCSELVCRYKELYLHRCKNLCNMRSKIQFFRPPLLYFESIRLKLTLKRAILQESMLLDVAVCDSCSLEPLGEKILI
jgi:hypothetical protein